MNEEEAAILYELEAMARRRADLHARLREIQAERDAGGPSPTEPSE